MRCNRQGQRQGQNEWILKLRAMPCYSIYFLYPLKHNQPKVAPNK